MGRAPTTEMMSETSETLSTPCSWLQSKQVSYPNIPSTSNGNQTQLERSLNGLA